MAGGADAEGEKKTWGQALAELNPFIWSKPAEVPPVEGGDLPPVDLNSVPQSWDLEAEHFAKLARDREARCRWNRRHPQSRGGVFFGDLDEARVGRGGRRRLPKRVEDIRDWDENSDVSMMEI